MRRFDNWASRLDEFLKNDGPLEWGKSDCCMFACNAAICISGVDPAKDFRGRYSTELGAKRILKRRGGLLAHVEKEAAKYGIKRVPPLKAQRGDIVLIDTQLGDALGIINLRGSVSAQGFERIVQKPITSVKAAWRIN